MKKGYDMDGVVTMGIRPERDAVIITGRSYERASETYEYLRSKGIFNAVYFNPVTIDEQTLENSADWKICMILSLSLEEFTDDDERQIEIIKNSLVDCKINHYVA